MKPQPKTSNMKKHLAKLAVVAVALVAVLSSQSEAAVAVAHAHHGGAKVHRVVKDKHHHKKAHHKHHCCKRHHKHGLSCVFHGCDKNRRMHRRH